MHCPFCNTDDTKVIDSRLVADGGQVRNRYGFDALIVSEFETVSDLGQ